MKRAARLLLGFTLLVLVLGGCYPAYYYPYDYSDYYYAPEYPEYDFIKNYYAYPYAYPYPYRFYFYYGFNPDYHQYYSYRPF